MSRIGRFLLVGVFLASCASADKSGAPPKPTREVGAGGAQLRGGGIRMDVQVGRGLTNRPGKAGAVVVTPHAAVAP